jgi:archaellum biogenesis ATPase FlaH
MDEILNVTAEASPSRRANASARPGPRLRQLDVAEMLATTPPEVPWLVEPLLVRGYVTLLAGREGEGKSFLAQALSMAVASGGTVAGLSARRGKVLVIDAENSQDEIHRRLRGLGLSPEDAHNLAMYEAVGLNLRRSLAELDRLLGVHRPDLLVLDSLRAIWQGDENSSAEVAPMLDGLRNLCHQHEFAALVLHHSPKNDSGFRGSTAIAAAAELWFLLGRAPDDPDRGRRFVECRKSRPAPEAETLWFRIATENGRIELVEVEPATDGARVSQRRETVPHRLAHQILDWIATQNTGVRRKDIATALGRPHDDRSVGRALDHLQSSEAIIRDGDLYALQPPHPTAAEESDGAPDDKQTKPGASPLPSSNPTPDRPANVEDLAPWEKYEPRAIELSTQRQLESPEEFDG